MAGLLGFFPTKKAEKKAETTEKKVETATKPLVKPKLEQGGEVAEAVEPKKGKTKIIANKGSMSEAEEIAKGKAAAKITPTKKGRYIVTVPA